MAPRAQPGLAKAFVQTRSGCEHVWLRRGACNVLPDASAFDVLLASWIQIWILQLNEFSFQESFGH